MWICLPLGPKALAKSQPITVHYHPTTPGSAPPPRGLWGTAMMKAEKHNQALWMTEGQGQDQGSKAPAKARPGFKWYSHPFLTSALGR